MQSTVYGYVDLPNGLKMVYGVYPMNGLEPDPVVNGKYTRTLDISAFGLREAVWACATARYPAGWPTAVVHEATADHIKIGSEYNLEGGAIQWMVIG